MQYSVDNSHKHAQNLVNPANIPHSGVASSSFSKKDDVKTATDFISKKLKLGANDFKVFDSYADPSGVTHVYGAHMANGARIANHQASAHVKSGEHLAKRDITVSLLETTVDFAKASATASAQLGIPVDSEFEHALEYVEQPDGKIVGFNGIQPRGLRDLHQMDGLLAGPLGVTTPSPDPSGKTTPATRNGVFDTQFNSRRAPGTDANIAAAAVNLFSSQHDA
ncbi:hypothetical protein BSLG_010809 [Batrachochytrium salamandrivorans]|nr:hypothetical protein BSLG_010809 [Batrachochytrium salamandrivorans]